MRLSSAELHPSFKPPLECISLPLHTQMKYKARTLTAHPSARPHSHLTAPLPTNSPLLLPKSASTVFQHLLPTPERSMPEARPLALLRGEDVNLRQPAPLEGPRASSTLKPGEAVSSGRFQGLHLNKETGIGTASKRTIFRLKPSAGRPAKGSQPA